jgi:hypothetical protein
LGDGGINRALEAGDGLCRRHASIRLCGRNRASLRRRSVDGAIRIPPGDAIVGQLQSIGRLLIEKELAGVLSGLRLQIFHDVARPALRRLLLRLGHQGIESR